MEDVTSSHRNPLSHFSYTFTESTPPPPSPAPQVPAPADTALPNTHENTAATPLRRSIRKHEGKKTPSRPSPLKRPKRGRAAPKVASVPLKGLPDYVAEDLDVLFCGVNPGRTAATLGQYYANSSNHFWACLHLSGFTPTLLPASEDSTLPEKYNLGLTNLLGQSSDSTSEPSRQEMANSVPALLAKVARIRPRVVCFNGKGMWLHVERSLRLQAEADGGGGLVARATETGTMPQEEEVHDLTERASVDADSRPVKPDPDSSAGPEPRCDVSRGHLLAVQKVEETPDTIPTTLGSVSSSPATQKKVAAQTVFAYGLQPFRAVHDMETNEMKGAVHETLFCAFPSTSGRVVSHQRNDKVVLFKKLREDLECIKAGTLDTSSMQLVRLPRDIQ